MESPIRVVLGQQRPEVGGLESGQVGGGGMQGMERGKQGWGGICDAGTGGGYASDRIAIATPASASARESFFLCSITAQGFTVGLVASTCVASSQRCRARGFELGRNTRRFQCVVEAQL